MRLQREGDIRRKRGLGDKHCEESGLASPGGYVSNSNIVDVFVCYVENRAFRWKVRASISSYSVGPVNVKLARDDERIEWVFVLSI